MEGIKRTRNVAKRADLVVAMVDATEVSKGMKIVNDVLNEQQQLQVEEQTLRSDHVLLVLNKLDLINGTNSLDAEQFNNLVDNNGEVHKGSKERKNGDGSFFGGGTYEISCTTQQGVDAFLDGLSETVRARLDQGSDQKGDGSSKEGALITRARHRQHVQSAVEALERFDGLSRQGTMAVDMAAEELRLAASELGRITGAVDVEDVLDVLFTDFCIGK